MELLDIEADIEEKENRLDEEPEVVQALRDELIQWLAEPRQPFGRAD